jgi:transcriptional regulator with XRE-family HTH domain
MNAVRVQLARSFAALSHIDRGQIAAAAGVSPAQVSNLIVGQPVSAIAFLRLCCAMAIDPLPQINHPWVRPGTFDFHLFALAFIIRRGLKQQSERAAAADIGIGAATIVRIERGDALSIGTVLKACIYIGCHPYSYFARPELAGQYLKNVSREIANQQSNKQEPETVAATVG